MATASENNELKMLLIYFVKAFKFRYLKYAGKNVENMVGDEVISNITRVWVTK